MCTFIEATIFLHFELWKMRTNKNESTIWNRRYSPSFSIPSSAVFVNIPFILFDAFPFEKVIQISGTWLSCLEVRCRRLHLEITRDYISTYNFPHFRAISFLILLDEENDTVHSIQIWTIQGISHVTVPWELRITVHSLYFTLFHKQFDLDGYFDT